MNLTKYYLLKERYNLFDQLCSIWFGSKDKQNLEQFKYKVAKLIDTLQDDKTIAEIEELINNHDSGWMKRFRELLPDLKPHQYRLAVYLYLDFSSASIVILTGKENKNSVYVDKSKLKSAILQLDPDVAEKLLTDLHIFTGEKSKTQSKVSENENKNNAGDRSKDF